MDSRLIWIVVIAAIAVALIAYVRWHEKINAGVVIALKGIWKLITDPRTCRVVETFFIEAAVLWFVFPLLDTLYDHGALSGRQLHGSFVVAGAFFIFALVIAHIAKDEKKEE